jgi:hypothetical protein
MRTFTAMQETGVFHCECYDSEGNLKWTDDAYNSLANEGQYGMLDVYLRDGSAPAGFYIRLFNDTPVKTDALSDLTGEPSGNGYAAAAVTRTSAAAGWPTLALDSGNYQATSKTVTFTASGGVIGPVTYAVLATSTDSSGEHVAFGQLSASRTLQNGDSLQVTYYMKQT